VSHLDRDQFLGHVVGVRSLSERQVEVARELWRVIGPE
jgi:hypothetical protein